MISGDPDSRHQRLPPRAVIDTPTRPPALLQAPTPPATYTSTTIVIEVHAGAVSKAELLKAIAFLAGLA